MLPRIVIILCLLHRIDLGFCQTIPCGSGRYQCRDDICVPRSRLCDGFADCHDGEDELYCGIANCKRNETWRMESGYPCKRPCNSRDDCRGRLKQCLCDDECGKSCINPRSECERPPPKVAGAVYRHIRRTLRDGSHRTTIIDQVEPPFFLGDVIEYTCENDKRLVGPLPRCTGHRTWTNELPVCVDFAECGKADKIPGSTENLWPWQVLISRRSNTPEKSLDREHLLSGGSILNKRWILTAAHTFQYEDDDEEWFDDFVISVGNIVRPTGREKMSTTMKMYSIEEYVPHEQYSNEDGTNYENDIALIKIGPAYTSGMVKDSEDNHGLTFGYYIRPVCLPCTGTCLTEDQLVEDKGNAPEMNKKQKCLKEEELLLSQHSNVIMTGFGHMNATDRQVTRRTFNPPKSVRQVLLQIESKSTCAAKAEEIRIWTRLDTFQYSDNIVCCKSHNPGVTSCMGDGGGPLVKEVRNEKTGESCWIQVGISSFGYGCGSQFPGYYTNVARYVPWIQSKINE